MLAKESSFKKSMRNTYKSLHDISARLDRTVALYKGEPVLIAVQSHNLILYPLEKYPNSKGFEIPFEDPDLDISSLELGYVNINPNCHINGCSKGMASWVARTSSRQYRQGVDPQRLLSQHPVEGRSGHGLGTLGYPLYNLIKENYPSVLEAVWMLTAKTHISVAISREVCFVMEESGIITVAVNRENIGSLIPSENRVYIKDHEFLWVIEKLLSRFQIQINPFKAMES